MIEQTPLSNNPPKSAATELQAIFAGLKRNALLIAGCVVLAIVLSLLLTVLMTPKFISVASIQIDRNPSRALDMSILEPRESRSDRDYMATQYEIIRSRAVAKNAIEILRQKYPMELLVGDVENQQQQQLNFLAPVMVKPVGNSRLVTVQYEDVSAEMAADKANAVVQGYLQLNQMQQQQTVESAKQFLVESIDKLKEKLLESESKLQAFAHQNQIVQDSEGESAASYAVKQQMNLLVQAESVRMEMQTREQRALKSIQAAEGLAELNEERRTELLNEKKQLENQLARKLNLGYESNSEAVSELRDQLKELDLLIANVSKRSLEDIKKEHFQARQHVEAVQDKLRKLQKTSLQYQAKFISFNTLKRQVETNQMLLKDMATQLNQVTVAASARLDNVKVIDEAAPPIGPYKPRLMTNLLLAVFIGLFVGLGIALMRELFGFSLSGSINKPA